MLAVYMDSNLDAVSIEFEGGTASYAVELDEDRIVDYSLNPGHPIGVSLHNVSDGVLIEGLPQPDKVRKILHALDVETR